MKCCNIKGANGLYYRNMRLVENLEDYNEYIELSFDVEIEDSQREIITKIKDHGLGHCTHDLGEVGETISNITGKGAIYAVAELGQQKKEAILKLILKGYKVVINSRGGYFELCDNDIIEPHIEYSEQDIKITRWRGGKHYYAKVGHIDVEDGFGNVKWNTETRAREIALKYMYDLNTKAFEKSKAGGENLILVKMMNN